MYLKELKNMPIYSGCRVKKMLPLKLILKLRLLAHKKTILYSMKLTAILMFFACISVSAKSKAQRITWTGTNVSLKKVFSEIKKQSGFTVFYNYQILETSKKVSGNIKNAPISEFLDLILEDQNISYTIEDSTIILIPKSKALVADVPNVAMFLSIDIHGRIENESGAPLQGITITVKGTRIATSSDENGNFSLKNLDENVVLEITGVNVERRELKVMGRSDIGIIRMKTKIVTEEEIVINTGFQKLTKERSTGSFTFVDKELLSKQVSVNLFDRLETSANSVTFNKGTDNGVGQLMVRGISTIKGPKSPLIVIDNFPYEGDLQNINPNIVENITILRDAAASSIWGAKAANGVIVITTKKSSLNSPLNLSFHSTYSIGNKPDLSYIKMMNSSDFIDVETELFNRGFYESDIYSFQHPVLSPVVDLLYKGRDGIISKQKVLDEINSLRKIDVRDEYKKYMYRPSLNRQYSLELGEGYSNFSWMTFLGFDDNLDNIEAKYRRLNLKSQNVWKISKKIQWSNNISLNQNHTSSGRSAYGSIKVKSNGLPYIKLADELGNPLIVVKEFNQDYKSSLGDGKLLDWNYYPLTDWQFNSDKSNSTEIILNSSLNAKIFNYLSAEISYQHWLESGSSHQLQSIQGYAAKDMVNKFTSISNNNVIHNIPKGDIMSQSNSNRNANNFRGQLMFDKMWGNHNFTMLAGGEIRISNIKHSGNKYYGYNPSNLAFGIPKYDEAFPLITGGYDFIPNGLSLGEFNNNYVSGFLNSSYTLKNRYIFSGSVRKDASNLFGLNTNDQWNPFWSVGGSWDISKEKFYKFSWVPKLKFRTSYGFNGNIDPSMVASSTISYSYYNSPFTGSPMAMISNYYNPELKWELMEMINAGIDFSFKNNRISGSIEVFHKRGKNLFGVAPMDYTTGVNLLTKNAAGMKGRGIDIHLKSLNLSLPKFKWYSILNFSTINDKITKYHLSNTFASQFLLPSVPISGLTGYPVYSMFGYKWAGLDPATGDPLGYLNGEISKDYSKITGIGTDVKDLQYFGSALPTIYGNFTNTFSLQNFSVDIGISYKMGYYFRKSTINYTSLFYDWVGHSDYAQRWQKPGDELTTNIPSNVFETNIHRDAFFAKSSVLIEKADHIRLQFINLSYVLNKEQWKKSPFNSVEVFGNVNNLGILWQASKSGIDPDYNLGEYSMPPVKNFSLGIKVKY